MKTLRFGLLGPGYFGRNYLRLLQEVKGIELAAAAARTTETLTELAGKMPKTAAKTTDSKTILENPDIDCVVIATPAATHLELALEALRNGKHVLLEKPMAMNLEEAKKLRAAAKKSQSAFMVGHQFVYNDHVRFLRSLLEKGTLGSIKYAYGEHLLFQARNDIGCFWDAAPHQLSMIRYLLNPGRISKANGVSLARPGSGLDDFTAATAEFESGLAATIIVSCQGSTKTRKITLAGRDGMAFFDDMQADKLKTVTSGKPETAKTAAREPLRNQLEHFIQCIHTGQEPLTGIESSYEITEWMDKIQRSVKRS